MIFVNELTVWDNGVPVVAIAGDPDFTVWLDEVPVVDQDEGNPNQQPRRRADIM